MWVQLVIDTKIKKQRMLAQPVNIVAGPTCEHCGTGTVHFCERPSGVVYEQTSQAVVFTLMWFATNPTKAHPNQTVPISRAWQGLESVEKTSSLSQLCASWDCISFAFPTKKVLKVNK